MQQTPSILFDRAARRKHLLRARATLPAHDFLFAEGADILIESLLPILRPFPRIAELYPRTAHLSDALRAREGTQMLITGDTLVMDEELLPFADDSLDAIVSNLSLHTVNDLPGMLIQARRALKPDGLFLATMPGAGTLQELRDALAQAEATVTGGITPRVAPFLEVRDAGNLLQRAGFALPVVDSVSLQVQYSELGALLSELRGSGEQNMLQARQKHFTRRQVFVQAAKHYAAHYRDAQGHLNATVEIITLCGWKPAPNQQQPAKRGSGMVHLNEVLKDYQA
jgi:SAM-dependent methyltransferase